MDKITFKRIESTLSELTYIGENTSNNTGKPNILDKLITEKVNKDGFSLVFSRSVEFEPVCLFSIRVKYQIDCIFTDESKSYYNNNLDEINKFIEKRKFEILESTNIIAKTSLLIASITNISKNNPLILPPRFVLA